MPSMTIRDVPDAVHDELVARAERAGQSLQRYMHGRLIEMASQPDLDDLLDRAERRAAASGTRLDADELLAWRDADRR